MTGTARIIRGNALALPLADASVDLIVTSPPYFGLRSYQDGGKHYPGQIGSEATPAEFVDALIAATREMMRVLKPSGSIFVNLGDKYSQRTQMRRSSHQPGIFPGKFEEFSETWAERAAIASAVPEKSLMGIPWRYALRCIDDLGLILRAEIIWSKPNGLPESVTDRVRRSHETWFHLTKQGRYFSAVDEIREMYSERVNDRQRYAGRDIPKRKWSEESGRNDGNGERGILGFGHRGANPFGKLPGSVWSIPTQPLQVPPELGVDHFAAFPLELPRRIILGWSPPGICTRCTQPRSPWSDNAIRNSSGYGCDCLTISAPTAPATILDPFGGTGTTALVAKALGRHGISIDLSFDYCRLATWRTTDPGEMARAMEVEKPPEVHPDQLDLFDGEFGERVASTKPSGGLALSKARGQDCGACGYRMQYAGRDSCEKCGAHRGERAS